ncbi:MAG: hypothetical protein AAF702_21275 [Chloroflexota bacterium]
MLEQAKEIHQNLIDWRRNIHMYPELGFEETETARLVTQRLEEMGLEAQTGVGKTGVIGYLGRERPSLVSVQIWMRCRSRRRMMCRMHPKRPG